MNQSETHVRLASLEDEAELFSLLRVFHKEEGLAPLDERMLFGVLRNTIQYTGIVGVIGEPGKIEASINLIPSHLWYTNENAIESLWNYVLPAYRKSANAKSLVTFARGQSQKLRTPLLLDVVTNAETLPKVKLYERVLGEAAGAVFHYKPHPEKPTELGGVPVRTATMADQGEIYDICRELHGENGSFSADEEYAEPIVRAALEGNGLIGAIGEPGSIEAIIYLRTARLWYSDENLLEELFAYVRPNYRNSHNARTLINFAKRQADRLNVPLRMGIVSRLATQQKVRLYQRLLGEQAGSFFLYKPEGTA